jgi:hypothetical protein
VSDSVIKFDIAQTPGLPIHPIQGSSPRHDWIPPISPGNITCFRPMKVQVGTQYLSLPDWTHTIVDLEHLGVRAPCAHAHRSLLTEADYTSISTLDALRRWSLLDSVSGA